MTELTRQKTIYTRGGIETHHLAVIGDKGAIHFHFRKFPESMREKMRGLTDYWPYTAGGVEVHRLCGKDDNPDHEHCWLLNAPCKHDGSTLYAVEVMLPLSYTCGEDFVYCKLEQQYRDQFEEREEG